MRNGGGGSMPGWGGQGGGGSGGWGGHGPSSGDINMLKWFYPKATRLL